MIVQKYNSMTEKLKRKMTSVLTKKQLIERNYHLLEVALKIVPLPILSCEESLLSGILLANSSLFDNIKEQIAKEEKTCKLVFYSLLTEDKMIDDEQLSLSTLQT